jgi:hypothetical protein
MLGHISHIDIIVVHCVARVLLKGTSDNICYGKQVECFCLHSSLQESEYYAQRKHNVTFLLHFFYPVFNVVSLVWRVLIVFIVLDKPRPCLAQLS